MSVLDVLIELLQAQVELETSGHIQSDAPHGNTIFVVHGHNEVALHTVARYLAKLKLPTIILREQPNKGRTIIEKFIDY